MTSSILQAGRAETWFLLLMVSLVAGAPACAAQSQTPTSTAATTENTQKTERLPPSSNEVLARWPDRFRVVVEYTKLLNRDGNRTQRQFCTHDLTISRTEDGWDVQSDFSFDVPSVPASDQEVNRLYETVRCTLPSFTLDAEGSIVEVDPLTQYDAAREVFLDYYERKGGQEGLAESVAMMASDEMKRLDVEGLIMHLVPSPWMLNHEVGDVLTPDFAELDHVLETSVVRLEDGPANGVNCQIFKSNTVMLPRPDMVATFRKLAAPMGRDFGKFRMVDQIHYFMDTEIGLFRAAAGDKTIEGGSFTGEDALGASKYFFELKSYQQL